MKKTLLLLLSSLLFFSTSMAADKSAKKAIKLLDKVRKDLVSLSADFRQYELDANQRQSESSYGKVWLQTPNKFKWRYLKPVEQLISANGQQIWVYDADLEQVTLKQQRNSQNPIYVLLSKEQTEKNYSLQLQELSKEEKKLSKKDKADTIQWINMQPKRANEDVKQVWLGVLNTTLAVLKFKDQMDNTVVFEFSSVLRNPELQDDFFTFMVPKGVDVIRDSADIGEF